MGKFKIKTGDVVQVITGDHKGSEGKVMAVDFSKNRATVEGVNLIKKHQKPSANNPQGGIVQKEAPIHISNLSLVENGKPVRVRYEIKEGKKVRVSAKTGQTI